jgi:superfamily I DNA/RNA helicase
MDKRVIFAVAGSGKTTYIVDNLSADKRSLIVTYTNGNHDNLRKKIIAKFDDKWPENITLMTYFSFLYNFCYKPFLSDKYKSKGLFYEPNSNKYAKQTNIDYYMAKNRYLYSNRLALFLEKNNVIDEIRIRIETYFDEFIIDEVQDISGRDFTLLESLMATNISMLFVGDFYQHTFDTSRDGRVNGTLFDDKAIYETRFTNKGLTIDNAMLTSSWRCSRSVCKYINDNLDIEISSNRPSAEDTSVEYITDVDRKSSILEDPTIIKLHYKDGAKSGIGHKNWGESKGEDYHNDVCVMLNKNTAKRRSTGELNILPTSTKNKLYVAITRAKGNVYLIDES